MKIKHIVIEGSEEDIARFSGGGIHGIASASLY